MKLQCPQCGAPVPAVGIFLPARHGAFACRKCGAPLAWAGNGRTFVLTTIAVSLFVSGLVRDRVDALLPAVAVLTGALLVGGLLTWRLGELSVRAAGE